MWDAEPHCLLEANIEPKARGVMLTSSTSLPFFLSAPKPPPQRWKDRYLSLIPEVQLMAACMQHFSQTTSCHAPLPPDLAVFNFCAGRSTPDSCPCSSFCWLSMRRIPVMTGCSLASFLSLTTSSSPANTPTAPKSQTDGSSPSTANASTVPTIGCRHWNAATCPRTSTAQRNL
jgi:hypothetical protein